MCSAAVRPEKREEEVGDGERSWMRKTAEVMRNVLLLQLLLPRGPDGPGGRASP